MHITDEIILVAGLLSLLAVIAGLASTRVGTPLLLALIGIGMLAGSDGPGGIEFENFQFAYLVGSVSLAVILFQGGLTTERSMIRETFWPSITLATVGVAISTVLVGAAAVLLFRVSWPEGFLLGAVTAPTDAAAVSVLLRTARIPVPARVAAALEVESGVNDPMSVFLTVGLVQFIIAPHDGSLGGSVLLFLREMAGGAGIGLVSGYALVWLFRRLSMERSALPLVALGCALTVFGGAQVAGASGFLAT